jgi:hypothetical protein
MVNGEKLAFRHREALPGSLREAGVVHSKDVGGYLIECGDRTAVTGA